MTLLKIDWEALGVFVAAAGLVVVVIAWWFGKFLTDQKDVIILQQDMKHVKEKLNEHEDEIKSLKRKR